MLEVNKKEAEGGWKLKNCGGESEIKTNVGLMVTVCEVGMR